MSIAVGKKLRQAREANDLSLEQASQATHIRLHYLQAMETGNFGVFPSSVQVKGFLRSYAGFLHLDAGPLIEAMERDPMMALVAPKDDADPEQGASDSPEDDSEASFAAVGQTLKSRRELLGLSIEDIEQHTHLRIRYLKAMEAGDLDGLPSPVQGRGMLKNYANFLSLDSDQLLLRFADGLQVRRVERHPEPARLRRSHKKPTRRARRFFSKDVLIGMLLVLFLVAFIVWGGLQITSMRAAEEPAPTPPSIADVLGPSPTATSIPTATPTIPSPLDEENVGVETVDEPVVEETQVIIISENAEGAVQVQIVIRQRAWMRISVDGEVAFDGRVIPGSAYAFAGEEFVEIFTGNGAGLQVFYNELDLGTLGTYGEVINFVITASGVQTPTPSITPTATETPAFTPTPKP